MLSELQEANYESIMARIKANTPYEEYVDLKDPKGAVIAAYWLGRHEQSTERKQPFVKHQREKVS